MPVVRRQHEQRKILRRWPSGKPLPQFKSEAAEARWWETTAMIDDGKGWKPWNGGRGAFTDSGTGGTGRRR